MQKIGTNRQISLTEAQCKEAGIKAGDEVEVLAERDGIITIAKKQTETPKTSEDE